LGEDSVTRRSVIKSLIEEQLAAANAPRRAEEATKDRVLAGPVRAMSLTLDRIEEESRALQQALATGASVVDLDPHLVDASFVQDRFAEAEDTALSSLKESMREHGQEVPILVRPHPLQEGRYQAAYGHRRLRAARELGLKIKAVVRALDDHQLVVAQGVENSARRDLSFIERAMFARALEDGGFDRPVIMAALSTDKTELSKMISAARALPESIVRAIGPAPKAGRRRWLQLAELLQKRDVARRVEQMLRQPDLSEDSDIRFARALAVAIEKTNPPPPVETLKRPDGAPLARVTRDAKATVLRFDDKAEPDFANYVVERLNGLYEEFRSRQS
jgi:ParB family transcriptional regulator, chromosome partitioning protein